MRPEAREVNKRIAAILEERRRNPTKRCPRCGRTLPLDRFRPAPRLKAGVTSWCGECMAEATRQWRAANPETVAAYNERRRLPQFTRTCEGCGVTFTTSKRVQKCCSTKCNHRRHERARYHRNKAARP
jgi:hypothetical protein